MAFSASQQSNPIPPKSIIVFCDGTSQDGLISRADDTGPSDGATTYFTNVLRLSRSVRPYSKFNGVDKEQIVFYQTGVGSEADFYNKSWDGDLLLASFGTTVASKIRDAYAFIAGNYRPGDDICLFGFSRGSYTVRKISGLIQKIGLLSKDQMGLFYAYWQDLAQPGSGIAPPIPTTQIPIKVIGCFDTVGSVWLGLKDQVINALSIEDNSLIPGCEVALHAMSFHEDRDRFMLTQWDEKTKLPNQIVKQVFFAGAHADVGGGYEIHEMSDISLFWMVDQITSLQLLDIDTDFIARTRSTRAGKPAWGASQPHNSWQELKFAEKFVIGPENRLKGGQFAKTSVFHKSLANSPLELDNPSNMITLNDLHKAFGKDWTPIYTELGPFELKMQAIWNDPAPVAGKPTFEQPQDIIPMLTGGQSLAQFNHHTLSFISEIPNAVHAAVAGIL
ncbi:hypothetical protein SISNIDRAFT_553212 [Sistotremastrum niveocremeum HHB9708]|uniref:T6SS Phospholipase effector Tle1-like catalytic domain-containing protein n=1 Tax=Sistotremastrum niveocremeum HHB9708 TaxID=1314777 RepID=A0A164N588_9AGAM|nr:hypothetical protein SISNIDRAFT_553212 [Sistotremastrum niveocremeum HHB9708]